MLAKRIIPCLDVKGGKVVKGIRFRDHREMGDIVELARYYSESGADEIVFYDITASSDQRTVSTDWVKAVAKVIDIPFCVAGGIRSIESACELLNAGADKISINSPALENPQLINELASVFGRQCVVIGIDSVLIDNEYRVCLYSGDTTKMLKTERLVSEWVLEVQDRGAGEIVLNCMDSDGVRRGYDIEQLKLIRRITNVPLIASGGAGDKSHFLRAFQEADVAGTLAATVFHTLQITIPELKTYLSENQIVMRETF